MAITLAALTGMLARWAVHPGAARLEMPEAVEVAVRWNVVTLSGEVDRKSDAQIITRTTRELDGVVEVVDRLRFRWDDTQVTRVPAVPAIRAPGR